MKYSEIKVNQSNHVEICPHCSSDVGSDDLYCPICGTYLINQCTGMFEDNNSFDVSDGHISFETEYYSGCGMKLPGYARYCSRCGAISSFGFQKLLKPWSTEYKENNQTKESAAADNDLPF